MVIATSETFFLSYQARLTKRQKEEVFWAPNGTLLSALCHFTGLKNFRFPGPNLLTLALVTKCTHPKHYAQGCINHRCIGGFMYKSPQGRFQGPYCGGWGSRCLKELNRPAWAAPPHYKTY
jgi:hypothetical protein